MALVLKDRVKGWTDSYGEDNFVIFATTNGYQSFSVIGNGNQTYYTVFDPTNYDWEVGIGTYTAATTTLSRDTILSSSNNNLIVSFLPGTKELFVGYPAEKAVTLDTPQTITDKTLVSATVTSGTINNTTIGATTPASGAFTTLMASGASLTSVNAGVALLTSATVTTLNATGASIASANIGNLQFTAASIASINAGIAVITNLTATSASIASMNAGVALLTNATVTTLNATGASIASANIGNLQFTAASIASINAGVAVITNLTATSASIASMNAGVALVTTATITGLTATGASVASANVGTAVVTGLTVTNASIASLNAGTATITTGNLTFSSTGQRITGDMSNATVASRLFFQNNTTNAITRVGAIPNGTATESGYNFYNTSAVTTGEFGQLYVTSSEVTLRSAVLAGGSFLPMTFYTGGSERMRLDTSGNLGIGTAGPSAKLDVATSINLGLNYLNVGYDVGGGAGFVSGYNVTYNGGVKNVTTGALNAVWYSSDSVRFYTNSSAAGGTTASERMRIDSSGNVGIGGTAGSNTRLDVLGTAPLVGGTARMFNARATIPTSTVAGIGYQSELNTPASGTLTTHYHFYSAQGTFGAGSAVTNQYGFYAESNLTSATNNYGFYSNIASGSNRWNFYAAGTAENYFAGIVRVGNTANPGAAAVGLKLEKTATQGYGASSVNGTGTLEHWYYYNPNGLVGTISTNGSATAYNTSSDRRLKENIAPADDAGALVDAIQIVKHDWKVGGHTRYGVVAQDLHSVFPEAVAEGDNGDEIKKTWGVDYSKLVPILVKELQAVRARLAALEAK